MLNFAFCLNIYTCNVTPGNKIFEEFVLINGDLELDVDVNISGVDLLELNRTVSLNLWVRSISFPVSTPLCSLGCAPDKS